jgi:hypothetical protein
MKTVTKEYKLYRFNELPEEGKRKARIDYIDFLANISQSFYNDNGKVKEEYKNYFVIEVINEMEKMQTPWFFGDCLYHEYQKELDNEIILNDYDFTEEGEIFNK